MRLKILTLTFVLCVYMVSPTVSAAERPMMQPRVPEDQLAEARAMRNPLPDSPEVLEKGKALYHGRGTCFNCHGKNGAGDGVAAMGLDPAPRNFRHHGFWRHRTEGEIFWVIKNGSSGTGMVGFGAVLTDEEIWSIMQYERSFAGDHGPMRGMGPDQGMGRRGPRHGMGREGMGQQGPGGMDPREGQCCEGPESAQ
jgi:mono/diheme cytochrome c family protein